MNSVVMVNSHTTKESQTFSFAGADTDVIADKVALVMARRGYHLESGTKSQGVYGRGSAAAFAVLGPFVNRQKYNLTIAKDIR